MKVFLTYRELCSHELKIWCTLAQYKVLLCRHTQRENVASDILSGNIDDYVLSTKVKSKNLVIRILYEDY